MQVEDSGFRPKWRFPGPEDKRLDLEGIYGTPVAAQGVVYFGAYDDNVYALDLESGRPAWDEPFKTDGPVIGGVALGEEALYVGSDDGKLYALEPRTGTLKGRCETDDSIWATPLVAGGTVYVASLDRKLYAFDAASLARGSCQERWFFEADAGLLSTPVLADDTVLIGGIDRRLYAVDAVSGQERWSFKAEDWFWTRPLVEGGVVYAGSLDGHVYALDLASGQPAWEEPFEAETVIRAAPVILAGVLVVADRGGNLYGLDPATGGLVWGGPTAPVALNDNVLGDPIPLKDHVLISTPDGLLFRLDPKAGTFQRVGVP